MAAKIFSDLSAILTTSDGLAKCFDLTRPRIIQLAKDGILERDKNSHYAVQPNIINFLKYAKKAENQGKNAPSEGQVDYWQEKALHERDKRALTEINLGKKLGQIHDAKDVELVMTEMLVNIRTKLQGFPTTIAPKIVDKNQELVYGILNSEVEKILTELSDYKPELFDTNLAEDDISDEFAED